MAISRGILLKGLVGGLAFAGSTGAVLLANGGGKNEDDSDSKETSTIAPNKEDALGIPSECKSNEVEKGKSKTCQLSKEQLGKVKFVMKEGNTSVEVIGLEGENKVELTIEKVGDGEKTTYPKGKKYTLKSTADNVTIKGTKERDIVLLNNKGVGFREIESGGKLELVPEVKKDPLELLGDCKLVKESSKECKLDNDRLKKIKFKNLRDSNNVTVNGLDKGKEITLKLEKADKEKETYPTGIKYIFKGIDKQITITAEKQTVTLEEGKITYFKNNDGELEKVKDELELDKFGIPVKCRTGFECELSESDLKNVKFKDLGDSGITVTGLGGSKKIKLKKATNGKYVFKNNNGEVKIEDSSKTKNITLKANSEPTFKKNNDRLEKISEGEKKDNPLGLPAECDLSGSGEECDISMDDLKKINFSNKGTGELKVTVTEGTPTIKFKKKSEDHTYKDVFPDQTKYIFDVTGGNIEIGDENNKISLIKDTDIEFKKNDDGKLEKAWGVVKLGERINFECKEDSEECTMFENTIVKVTNNGKDFEKFKVSGGEALKAFKYCKDESGYNQGFKFIPEEDINSGNVVKLTKNSGYEIKYKSGKDSD